MKMHLTGSEVEVNVVDGLMLVKDSFEKAGSISVAVSKQKPVTLSPHSFHENSKV
jgi:hypothetical protein